MRVFDNVRCRRIGLTAAMGILLLVGMTAGASAAPLLFNENFNYPTGNLVGNDSWAQTGSVTTTPIQVTTPGLSLYPYPNDLGEAVTLYTGQDVNSPLTGPVTAGSIYFAFLTRVTSATATGDYFFHLGVTSANTFDFFGRVFAKSSGSGVAFGISKSSISTTNPAVYASGVYSLGEVHLIVGRYTFNTVSTSDDTVDLWIDPAIDCEPPAPDVANVIHTTADATTIGEVNLRQASANAPRLELDGIRVGTTWSDVVAGGCGACCNEATGYCIVTSELDCARTWLGLDVPCNGTTCPVPPPTGACCDFTTGACTVTTEAACGFSWLGAGVPCNTTTCPVPAPTGACCDFTTGNCTVTTEVACLFSWLGAGVPCDLEHCPLPPPLGACCDPSNGECHYVTEANCPVGFNWHSDWTCDPVNNCPVPPPTGACCDTATGACTITTELGCAFTWLGANVPCNTTTCPVPPPKGACCNPDTGECAYVEAAGCQSGWTWMVGVLCAPTNPCPPPPPVGACCDLLGACTMTTEVLCVAPSVWYGTLDCANNPCPPPVPTKDTTWGQIKSNYR